MDTIKRGDDYVVLCNEAIEAYDKGNYTLMEAAVAIRDGYPNGMLHPMLGLVYDLAWDIAEFNEFDSEDIGKSWRQIVENVAAYAANKWTPTCLMIVAMYSRYEQEKIAEGLTLTVKRLNGTTTVESGNKVLNDMVEKLAAGLNPQQTDTWFLLNLLRALPEDADKFKLEQATVGGNGSGLQTWYPLD